GIRKIQNEKLQINLAISLYAPNDALRSRIIPANAGIVEILQATDEYIKKTKRQVVIEYVLIEGVNDSDNCANELAKLMKRPLYFLNLILYNKTGDFSSSSTERVIAFKNILEKERINFSQRHRFGEDIKGACGQFSTTKKSREA
ncbi:MAG: 23S rRNA (adenine(2503)-C(2))-methyltransferase RlmN, partial [bacterium]|nr:23S rRNA (adenine(2503)-C(2))-methyltransferase RlmN [bacterium]